MLIKEDGSRKSISPRFGERFTNAEIANHLECGAICFEEWTNINGESFRVYFSRQDTFRAFVANQGEHVEKRSVNRAFASFLFDVGLFTNSNLQPSKLTGSVVIIASKMCN